MAYNFSTFKQGSEATIEWLKREYSGLRTGRAAPAILDTVSVEAYGSKAQINALANINIEDSRTIRIVPWDATVAKAIESAIQQSNLGLSVATDERGLRVSFPMLTSERRTELAKVAKAKLEEARVRLRSERQKVLNDLDKKETAGEMSEDDKNRGKNELQKMIDETNKKLEELADKKEKEILE
jgi:ribosome recycling factor